jgi:hypothetical protein
MPRFGFGSPSGGSKSSGSGSGSGNGGGGISLNSPRRRSSSRSSSSKPSKREERIEQARQQEREGSTRRRNFGFLKSGVGKTERSKNSNSVEEAKRRERAKQLANLAYSDDPLELGDPTSIATTATASSENDFHRHNNNNNNNNNAYNMDTNIISPTTKKKKNNNNTYATQRLTSPSTTPQRSRPRSNNNNNESSSNISFEAFGSSDPFSTASFDNNSIMMSGSKGSAAHVAVGGGQSSSPSSSDFFETDFFSNVPAAMNANTTPSRSTPSRRTSGGGSVSSASSKNNNRQRRRNNQPPISLDHFFDGGSGGEDSSSVSSFNNNVGGERSTIAGISSSGGASVTSNSNSNSKNAAARRRMRSHMRHTSSSNASCDASSVGSESVMSIGMSVEHPPLSFHGLPPQSPGMILRGSSNHSGGGGGGASSASSSASKNRISAYNNNNGSAYDRNSFSSHDGSGGSGSGSNSNNINSSFRSSAAGSDFSGASPSDLFDSNNLDGGFTFDAFGLDESQVEREVNDAMQDILGGDGFSIFVDKSSSSKKNKNNNNNNKNSGNSNNNNVYRKDSFGANESNVSDDSFLPQPGWDSSPNPSRTASPIPPSYSHSHCNSSSNEGGDTGSGSESFVDGFRVAAQHTPQRHQQEQNQQQQHDTTPQQRRLQRTMQQREEGGGGNNAPQGNSAAISAASKEIRASIASPLTTTTTEAFSITHGNKNTSWNDGDPWASSDDGGGRMSDFFNSSDADIVDQAGTARRLYSETQSDVQDYYAAGTAAATNAIMKDHNNNNGDRNSSPTTKNKYSDAAKSDVGVRRNHAPTFYQLPPEEPQYNNNRSSSSPNTYESDDQSDDMDQMQDDLTHEFAKDIVRKTLSKSPTGSVSTSSHRSWNHSRNSSSNRSDHQQQQQQQFREQTQPQPQTMDRILRYNEDDNNNENDASIEIQPKSSTATAPSYNNNRNVVGKSNYGSLRSSYNASKSNNFSQQPTRADENQNSSSSSSSSSSPAVPKWRQQQQQKSSLPHKTQEVDDSRNVNNIDRVEEKKEEEEDLSTQHAPQPQPQNIGSLKARWEAKSRAASVAAEKPITKAVPKEKSERTRRSISTMDNSFEMLTPAIVEERRQERNKNKFVNLRKSMGVVDDSTTLRHQQQQQQHQYQQQKPKSDSGGWRDGGSIVVDRVLDRVRRESSSPSRSIHSSGGGEKCVETKSEGGSTPSFLANVRLRKVASPVAAVVSTPSPTSLQGRSVDVSPPSNGRTSSYGERGEVVQEVSITDKRGAALTSIENPVERKLSYRERREMELKAQRKQEESMMMESPPLQESPQKENRNLTYRERREMELKTQQEQEQEESMTMKSPPQEASKKDVASMIRKRIAANRSNKSSSASVVSTDSTVIHSHPAASSAQVDYDTDRLDQNITHRHHQSSHNHAVSPFVPEHAPAPPRDKEYGSSTDTGVQERSSREYASQEHGSSPRKNPAKMLENLFSSRAPPPQMNPPSPTKRASPVKSPTQMLGNFLSVKNKVKESMYDDNKSTHSKPDVSQKVPVPDDISQSDVKSMLSGFLRKRAPPALPLPTNEDDAESLKKHHVRSPQSALSASSRDEEECSPKPRPPPTYSASEGIPALKDDPKFERYFRMLKMGLPLDVAKHAMIRDGLDPSILDHDPNKPTGPPLKEDPKFQKYFKMMKIGISMEQVKHSMRTDGLNPDIMNQDHSLPVITIEKQQTKIKKETHRRARLHWKTISNVVKNSIWDKVESEVDGIHIDEDEFKDLFQADLKASNILKTPTSSKKKGAAVRVIDSKRANNGGIILARLKMTHDQMADAVDRIDAAALTAEQIENVIEYLPTKEERDALEKYMLDGGQDPAEKFDGLCECEKFMVSMMTVKHAKRKIRALLFKLQFMKCMESIAKDAQMIDSASEELVNSTRLRQLLGIILQFGNRLNTAGANSKRKAGAFSLDSLSKLSQAKAFDKKTTFLHYIILIVQRNNELLLKYYDDIPTVLEADKVFWDQCQQDLEEVENQLENVRRIALHESRANDQFLSEGATDDDSLGEMELTLEEEVVALRATPTGMFTLGAIKQVSALREKIEHTKIKCMRVQEYFGESTKDTEPQEIFSAFSSFTRDFRKAKEEVFSTVHKRLREDRKKARIQTPDKSKSLPPTGAERPTSQPLMRASSHQPNMSKLFGDIQQRQPSSATSSSSQEKSKEQGRRPSSKPNAPSSRAGLLHSIKEQRSPSESNLASSRAGLLDSINARQSQSERNIGSSRAGLLNAITERQSPSSETHNNVNNRSEDTSITERQPSRSPCRPTVTTALSSDRNIQNRTEIPDEAALEATPSSSPPSTSSDSRSSNARETMRQKASRRRHLNSPKMNTGSNDNNTLSQSSSSSSSQNNTAATATTAPAPATTTTRSPRDAMRHHRRRLEATRAHRSRINNNTTNTQQQ